MRRTPPLFQPGPLTRAQAEALNQLARDLYNSLLDHFSAVPPLECQQDMGGVRYRLNESASTTSGMEFVELDGSPDLTAITTVIVDNGTLSTPGAGIARITNGGIGVREVDTAPSYTGITLVSFDQDDGFVLTQPVAGEVRLDMATATASQVGIVSLADQYLGSGIKTFDKVRVATTGTPSALSWVLYTNGAIVATNGNLYTGDPTTTNPLAIVAAGSAEIVLTAKTVSHDLTLSLDQSTRVMDLRSSTDVTQPKYSCRGTAGVSGTGGGGDTITGGIVTALGAAGSTGTVTLRKLTDPTGANGSLTFSNGRITAFTAPT